MWATNLKIVATVIATLAVYTGVANMIPQVQSAVPEDIEIGADATPEQLAAIGEELYNGVGGCTACHGTGTRAPDVMGVSGTTCAARVADQSCKEYLYESMVDPMSFVVEGFQPIMPDMSRTLSQQQIWALVAFLESQGGEISVTHADIATTAGAADAAGDEDTPITAGGEIDVPTLIRTSGCLACHTLDGQGGAVGPPLEAVAERDLDYIRRSIVAPNADTAQGYEAFAGTMPPTFEEMFTPQQLDALVQFLAGGGSQ